MTSRECGVSGGLQNVPIPNLGRQFAAIAVGLVVVGGAPIMAHAQPAPSSVDPGRVQERVAPAPPSRGVEVPASPTGRELEAPAEFRSVTFRLDRIELVGVTAYDEAQLASLWQGSVGRTVPAATLYDIANAITRRYREDGYILSRAIVPPQRIEGGAARIQVVEGYVADVAIEGDAPDDATVRRLAAKIVETRPLTREALERYLLLINDLPGVSARSVLEPGDAPGSARLNLVIARDPFGGYAAVDNHESRYTGPWKGTVALTANGPLGANDRATVYYVTSPDEGRLNAVGATVGRTIGTEGTTVVFDGSYASTKPRGDLRPAAIEGESYALGLTVTHPFIRSRDRNLYGRVTLDALESTIELLDGAFVQADDSIRTLRLGAGWDNADRWGGRNAAAVEISQGLGIFGASDASDADLSRANADGTFTKATAELSRLQSLAPVLPDMGLLVAVTGQISADPLLASEEFGFGGRAFGRGYDPSEIVGDDGIATKVELQYYGSPTGRYVDWYELYAFHEFGKVWNQETSAGEADHESLASAGVGDRLSLLDAVYAKAELAVPLTGEVASRGEDGDEARFLFSLSCRLYGHEPLLREDFGCPLSAPFAACSWGAPHSPASSSR
jgi:hemolysin activation/secretion protein